MNKVICIDCGLLEKINDNYYCLYPPFFRKKLTRHSVGHYRNCIGFIENLDFHIEKRRGLK